MQVNRAQQYGILNSNSFHCQLRDVNIQILALITRYDIEGAKYVQFYMKILLLSYFEIHF